jgi:hypothetical protein
MSDTDKRTAKEEDADLCEKVDPTEEKMQRKAEKNANPLAPPINTRAS